MDVLIAAKHTLTVDESRFSPEVREFIFAYGLKQLLNDAGSSGKNPDEKLGMAQKKLDALYAGTVRAQRTVLDPLGAEAMRIARERLNAALRAKGRKPKDVKPEALRKAVEELAARPDVRAAAEAAIAARNAVNVEDLL